MSQYYQTRDNELPKYLELNLQISALVYRLLWIEKILEYLQNVPFVSEQIIEILHEEGFDFAFTDESMQNDIQAIVNIEKRTQYDITELQTELKELDGNGTGGKCDDENFYQTLYSINEMSHVCYDMEKLTTYEYAILCKRLHNHIEQLNRKEYAG
jgi:hypothetical protein